MRAAACRALRGDNFGDHAAQPDLTARAAGHFLQCRVGSICFGDEFGVRVLARIGLIQARLIGEYHHHIGFDQIGHQ